MASSAKVVAKGYRIVIKSALGILAILYLSHRFIRRDGDDLSYLDTSPGVNATRRLTVSQLRHIRVYDLAAELTETVNETIYRCLATSTAPSFNVCVYTQAEDKYISAALLSSGVWEPYLTDALTTTLELFPEATLLDIGANIGYFTLLAAAMGHKVIAVEPYWSNVHHLHAGSRESGLHEGSREGLHEGSREGLHAGSRESGLHAGSREELHAGSRESGLHAGSREELHQRITVVRNAMSHRHGPVTLSDNDQNKGGITVLLPGQTKYSPSVEPENHDVPTVVLDDMLQLISHGTLIIKIDVEGYECRALARARRLLSRLHVPYIFMEWQKMYSQKHQLYTACSARTISRLVSFLTERGYVPYEIRSFAQLSPDGATSEWRFGDVFWRHESAAMIPGPS